MPIGDDHSGSLFFWLWGAEKKSRDLVIWLQGGPGCSSAMGMFTETGPFTYHNVGDQPKTNPYSWTNAANIVFIDQPIGTGFSTGTPTANDEFDVAKQFDGFLTNFFKEFAELQGMNVYVVGESYGGQYAPHVTRYQYQNGNKHNVKGFMVIDGVITARVLQESAVIDQFATRNQKALGFTDLDVLEVRNASKYCGYATEDFVDRYYKFPPTETFTVHGCADRTGENYTPFATFEYLAEMRNDCFDIYHVNTVCPTPESVLGDANADQVQLTYFDAPEVKAYIHAPADVQWQLCSGPVFPNGDNTPPPDSDGTLVAAIEGSVRSAIVQGNRDAL